MRILSDTIIKVFTQPCSALWVGACDPVGRPLIVRVTGIALVDDNTILCYAPMKFGSALLELPTSNAPISILAASTQDFESYQLKGHCCNVTETVQETVTEQLHNLRMFSDCIAAFGLPAVNYYDAFADDRFFTFEIRLVSVYDQSPKTNAGLKLN